MIRIMAPIAAVVVNHTGGPAILDEPFTMHCQVTGSVDHIQWWRNGYPISADNTTVLDMDNKTLTLNPVQFSDGGVYQCQAFNAVSNKTSSPYTVEVNYGPMTPVITGPSMALTGALEMLNCSSASHPPSHFSWYFNNSQVASSSVYHVGPLTLNMSGKYICVAYNNVTGKNSSAYKMLTVLAPVTNAAIKIVGAPAIINRTFTLSCDATGSVESVIWMYDGSQLYPDNGRNISMSNTILTFHPVKFYDNGIYKCVAFNPFSSSASDNFTLTVAYGPETPTIMGPSVAKQGDTVTLSCSASSYPPPHYKWYFNDSLVANTSDYETPPLTSHMGWMFTCMAFNYITGHNSSTDRTLTVYAPITAVHVQSTMSPAIEGSSYNLTCNVTGPVVDFQWMKYGKPLSENHTADIYIEKEKVIFKPVTRHDTGEYQCVAVNPVENMTSPYYTLDVNYGPETPTIMGPSVAKQGDTVTLSCSASSYPPPHYKWYFNDSLVANTSDYETPPLTSHMGWMFTCVAFNYITGHNSSTDRTLTVYAPITAVHVQSTMSPAIEGSSYNLTCNVTGPVVDFQWMKYGKPLSENHTADIYIEKEKVIFKPVTRHDTGEYQCVAVNPVENMTSPYYTLDVNFGPETPIIYGPYLAETGDDAIFNCHALSFPPNRYSWWYNGSVLVNTSALTLRDLTLNMSGNYTCSAFNPITGITRREERMFTVIEAIKSVEVQQNRVPIYGENYTLTCQVNGPFISLYWMKENVYLGMYPPSNPYIPHHDSNTLQFKSLTLSDDGSYQCVAFNQAGPHESPQFQLLVNYGPMSINVSGPDSASQASSVTLTCTAPSRPDCDFRWFFNNQPSAVNTGSTITIIASEKTMGNYTCEATNPVTKISMQKSKIFRVSGVAPDLHSPSQKGLILMSLFALSVSVLIH
ncbi:cell adhesion molecule CEACAM5-like [Aulostomus maculatus]